MRWWFEVVRQDGGGMQVSKEVDKQRMLRRPTVVSLLAVGPWLLVCRLSLDWRVSLILGWWWGSQQIVSHRLACLGGVH